LQKVLIIAAAQEVHSMLALRLADEPVKLHSAHDGEAGIASAIALGPDLILLDVDLPGVNGLDVCRRLKRGKKTREIPIILLAGASQSEEKMRGLDLGAMDYINKPFDEAELRARVWADGPPRDDLRLSFPHPVRWGSSIAIRPRETSNISWSRSNTPRSRRRAA